ncbi:MAG TPA: outer membrane beta-barrel protein [Candidatus Acidoferrum sp.]|nr:outer membrane beta-barrel protein [Candidatus Acidoferrum sp.]
MRIGITCLLGGLMCLAVSAPAKAQYGSSRLEKWEFTPFVGYETPGSFPLNSTSGTVTINDLRVNGATSFGTFIGYSIWSSMDFEFMWDRNLTSYSEQQTPGAPFMKAYNSTIDQYQFGPLFTLLGEEHKLRPFIAGGLGFTHEYNSGGNPTRMDFSYSIGGGVKYALTRHLSFRGDARYMPTYANSGLATYCDPFFGCYTAKVSQYQHRGNFVGGLAFRF